VKDLWSLAGKEGATTDLLKWEKDSIFKTVPKRGKQGEESLRRRRGNPLVEANNSNRHWKKRATRPVKGKARNPGGGLTDKLSYLKGTEVQGNGKAVQLKLRKGGSFKGSRMCVRPGGVPYARTGGTVRGSFIEGGPKEPRRKGLIKKTQHRSDPFF